MHSGVGLCRLVEQVEEFAAGVGCTPGQLALAWVLAQGSDVVPIPGTTRPEHLRQNVAALDVRLTSAEVAAVGELLRDVVGDRYARPHAYGDSPPRPTTHAG